MVILSIQTFVAYIYGGKTIVFFAIIYRYREMGGELIYGSYNASLPRSDETSLPRSD
jgi:hypothetical protein